jgi:transposase
VRATAVLNRLLGFPGTVVEDLTFTDTTLVVAVRLRSKTLVCPCGRTSRARYDVSRRRWRHIDFGRFTVFIEADIRRVDCRACGQIRTEWMPWARPGARHTRDFEDMAGWQVKRMSKAGVAMLLRTTWHTIDGLARRLVGDHLDTPRLDRLYRIGVDEIAYRKGRKFLTVVADHDTSQIVYVGEGRTQHVLATFFDSLGATGRQQIEAVSMDMTSIYRTATTTHLPNATICLDPFHVIKWVGEALELVYHATCRALAPISINGLSPAKTWQKVRSTLRTPAEKHTDDHIAIIDQLRRHHPRLYRAWQQKETLRDLYRTVDPTDVAIHLKRWITRALRSNINAFRLLATRLRTHAKGIIAAIQLGLSNSLLEGCNAGIRRIQARAHGYANLDNLIEMIYLCHGGISTPLPTETH